MSDNKRSGFGGKGYYIALVLCAAAIGITSYVYYRNAQEPEPVSLEETYEDLLVGTLVTEDVPVLATQPQATTQPNASGGSSTVPAPSATAPAAAEKRAMKTMCPVEGDPIFGYSMEVLSYNQTTRDWRVHNGIDLAAEAGTQVVAAADGEVYTVFEDDTLGHTVVIRHADGYTTKYCSLSEDIPVKAGDQVTLGQTIGYAADSAIVESALGSHVHFSVTHYDKAIDPADFFALGE